MSTDRPSRPTLSWSDLRHRKVGLWGLGVEGRAGLRKLRSLDTEPVIVDDSPNEAATSAGARATGAGGIEALLGCEVVIKTPGISRYRGDVGRLDAAGIPVVGGLGLWLGEADLTRVVCITGTKGKSTTTAIAAHLLAGLGHKVLAGGNLGTPPYDPEVGGDFDAWVIEVSSYQATDVAASPPVTAVTSLHPDHLPWHQQRAETYYADKLSLCRQPGADLTVANGDSPLLRDRRDQLGPRVRWVHSDDAPESTWVDRLGLLGLHNRRNALIALACLDALGVSGVADDERLGRAAEGLPQMEGRLRRLGTVGDVLFVDDSLSTNVLPALAAVDSFPGRRLALILGGADRGIDYGPLAEGLAGRPWPTLVLVTASETAAPMTEALAARSLGPQVEVRAAGQVTEAAEAGWRWARPDGVVLLSPAASSFDRYRDHRAKAAAFAEGLAACRGRHGGPPGAGSVS
ncbi:MAG: UDP-N-acetylmuramoyl-L-alanine--D-glutamate ligase [Acidimicrobiales bacterium]